jgi:hypothetical protein
MLPVSLSGRIKAYPSGLTDSEYRHAAHLCAGRDVKLDDRGEIFAWEEQSILSFGSTVWYKDATDLGLKSFLAIGVPRTYLNGGDSRFVAAISAFPAVSNNLAARLPRALERVSSKSVTSRLVRAKLGMFLKKDAERLGDSILSLDFLLENGSRVTLQKGQAKTLRAPEGFLRAEHENNVPTTSESGWLQEPGLESVSLNAKHGTLTVARDLSIQMLDVAADLSDVAGSLSDLIGLLGPYLEVESSTAQASSSSD